MPHHTYMLRAASTLGLSVLGPNSARVTTLDALHHCGDSTAYTSSDLTESRTSRSSRYGSLTARHSLFQIMVARWSRLYGAHFGIPLWFGFPVRAKVAKAALILSASA